MLGVRVDALTRETLQEKIRQFFSDGEQHTIFTPNPEMIVLAQKDPVFKNVLNSGSLNIPDGIGIMFASLFLREKFLKERSPGVDALFVLSEVSAREGKKMYLLGGSGEVAEATASVLRARHPDLHICADAGGPISLNEGSWHMNPAVISSIQEDRPDVLVVALGHGKQERWIHDHLHAFPSVSIAMGVGGAFDYISGSVARAPQWMQKAGLEWLFRLFMNPRRIRRIFHAVVVFPFLVFRAKIKQL